MRVTAYSEKLKSSLKQVYRFRLTISRGETKDRHTVKYDNFSFVEVIMPVQVEIKIQDYFLIYWKIYFYRNKIDYVSVFFNPRRSVVEASAEYSRTEIKRKSAE